MIEKYELIESDDRIIMNRGCSEIVKLSFIIFGIFFGVLAYMGKEVNSIDLLSLGFSLFFILGGLYRLSVTIDKNSQKVIIKKGILNILIKVKEIPFRNLMSIVTTKYISRLPLMPGIHLPLNDRWLLSLTAMQWRLDFIYGTNIESDAERVANKISKITGKGQISYVVEDDGDSQL